MMGITHVFAGTLSAVALTGARTPEEILAALIGGSLGGIVCDMDLGKNKKTSDVKEAAVYAGAITLGCLAVDRLLDQTLIRSIQSGWPGECGLGLAGLILLWIWGWRQPHRGGTHSLLAMALFGACVDLICGMVSGPFLIGMASHLVLDFLNRKPLQLLYPLNGKWCLNLCKADGHADRLLQMAGMIGTAVCIGARLSGLM